jgi:hypothetical protein
MDYWVYKVISGNFPADYASKLNQDCDASVKSSLRKTIFSRVLYKTLVYW